MSLSDFDAVLDSMYGGEPSYTGKLVSQSNALQVSAVWACIDVLASDIATAPLPTYLLLNNGREPAKQHYLWTLLQHEANPEMTAWRFKHLMQTWLGLWGNAYAEIEISGRGQVTALWPWRPDRVKISRTGGPTGQLQYTYALKDGEKVTVPQDRMLHIRGLGTDGVYGLSPIQTHKQTIGMSMAITEHGGRFFGNGARPLGVLQYPGKLGDKAFESLQESWMSRHQGLDKAHRLAILEEGLTYKDIGFNMVDAQYLETMKFTIGDIARIYKVPPHRIGDLERSTNNNIEHQGLEYVQYSIGPIAANWEQEINFSLLSPRERATVEAKFNFRHLIRGDYAAMGTFMGVMADKGIMNADEMREEFLDMNPQLDGVGKDYYKQINTAPVGHEPAPAPSFPVAPVKPKTKTNGALHQ